jgi:hypothetical protein
MLSCSTTRVGVLVTHTSTVTLILYTYYIRFPVMHQLQIQVLVGARREHQSYLASHKVACPYRLVSDIGHQQHVLVCAQLHQGHSSAAAQPVHEHAAHMYMSMHPSWHGHYQAPLN